jgi:hypothetical protein
MNNHPAPENILWLLVLQIKFFIFLSAELNNRGKFAAAALVEGNFPVRKGKKSVIAAAADIRSGMNLGSALTG